MSTYAYQNVLTIPAGTTDTTPVTLAGYYNPTTQIDTIAVLTVDEGGSLAPTAANSYAVYSPTDGEVLNSGAITGGNVDATGVQSGVGVYLVGGRLDNYYTGVIRGGAGSGAYAGGLGVGLRYSGPNLASNNLNYGKIYGGDGGTAAAGGTAVYLVDGAYLENEGGSLIEGGAGGAADAGAGAGGIGVDIASGGSMIQFGVVRGGAGGNAPDGTGGTGGIGIELSGTAAAGLALGQYGRVYGGTGGSGAAGGTGIYLQGGASARNSGGAEIVGGVGGAGGFIGVGNNEHYYAAGTGGMGAKISAGTLYNYGSLVGGSGGVNSDGALSGDGGVGAYIATGATLANIAGHYAFGNSSASVTGGAGVAASTGGTGVQLGAAAAFANFAAVSGGLGGGEGGDGGVGVAVGSGTLANVAAGAGGDGHFGSFTTTTAASISGGNGGSGSGFFGGVGGAAVSVDTGTVTNDGSITGGTGGESSHYSFPYGAIGIGAHSGAGGDGLLATGAATLSNSGTIAGGAGGAGSQPPAGYVPPTRSFARDVPPGNGGIGVDLGSSGATLTNTGTIRGGAGGVFHLTGSGTEYAIYVSTGGAGVSLTAGTVHNSGVITGGGATYRGGAGVYLGGGTLDTSGTISGGAAYVTTGVNGVTGYGGDAVQFGTAAAMMNVSAGAMFNGDIAGFKVGDVIDITNLAMSVVEGDFNSTTHVLTTGTDGTLDFAGTFAGETFSFTPDSSINHSGTDITLTAACYRRGTHVRTPQGERPIESLRIGDLVVTRLGEAKPIRWIGRRSYSRRWAGHDLDIVPVRFRPGALGAGLPVRDLWVSPEHAMWIDGMLIAARDLVNGVTIERDESVTQVSYIHLEFAEHEVIFAEGALSESFADDESRGLFENAAEYRHRYPALPAWGARFCAPRVEDGAELEAVRRRLGAGAPVAI